MVKTSSRATILTSRRHPTGGGGGGGGGGGTGGGDTTLPDLPGPIYDPLNPWRTPIPSDWFNYVHPDTPSMVQGVYIGTTYTAMDIHAFAYRLNEIRQKWGSGHDDLCKWAGPGHQENIVYVPANQPMIPIYVDWDQTTKTYKYRFSQTQAPLPSNWTGFNQDSAANHTGYRERRTSIFVDNAAGDHWIIYQPTPPGNPISYLFSNTDTFWHATHVEKVASWKTAAPPFWHGGGSGNPFGPGCITAWDVLNTPDGGHFNHAIAFNCAWASDGTQAGHPAFVYPSPWVVYGFHQNTDGRTKTNVGIPHGARIFLDPSLTDSDLNALGVTKEWQLQICRTLQVYGGISKESTTGQGGAGGIITESVQSINWNISQGWYPAGFKWPWVADGSTDSGLIIDNSFYDAAFPFSLMPTSGSHWKVFDWNKPYPGISAKR